MNSFSKQFTEHDDVGYVYMYVTVKYIQYKLQYTKVIYIIYII